MKNSQNPNEEMLRDLNQNPAIDLKDIAKKLSDSYFQSLLRIDSKPAFESCLEFLCRVNGSVKLGTDIQITRSKDSFSLSVNGSEYTAAELLLSPFQEYILEERAKENAANCHRVLAIDNQSRVEELEYKLRESKKQLQKVIAKSQSVIQSLLDSPPGLRRRLGSSTPHSPMLRASTFFEIVEEEMEQHQPQQPTALKRNKLEVVTRALKQDCSVISIGEPISEDERNKVPQPTSPAATTLRESLDSPRFLPPKSNFAQGIQSKVSKMIKYSIHVSSLGVVIALGIFSVFSIMTKFGLDNSNLSSIEIVGEALCAEVDPAKFMKDINYIQGPALTALSITALVLSITNYGLRLALENLKKRYSSTWLWVFPLIACVLEMVAVLLMLKGKSALSDFQMNLFKMNSMSCLKNPAAALDVFNSLFCVYGDKLLFTVVGAILSVYQLIVYLSNMFVIDFMQGLK